MLSSMLKEHQSRQTIRKEQQGNKQMELESLLTYVS